MAFTATSGSTSASLIRRVQLRDEEAWRRFAALYAPLVYRWARQAGLQESDAADVVQEVFRRLHACIGDFRGGQGSNFRGWLWVITRNEVRAHFRQRGLRPQAQGGSTALSQMGQVPEILESDSEPAGFDSGASLLHRALRLVKQDFSEQTWSAFWRVVMQGEAATDVAASLGLHPSAVRQAKYRVLNRLREEMKDA